MVIKWAVGILQRNGKILIAKLKEREPLLRRLEWTFPYKIIPEDESPRMTIKKMFSEEFGFKNVKVGKLITKFTPSENPNITEYIYEVFSPYGNVIRTLRYSQLQWIMPTQILKYFKTSIPHDVMDYLRFLEKKGEGIIL